MGYPLRERARRIDLFGRDFRTTQEDHAIAPFASGLERCSYIGPRSNGPKYSCPKDRRLCAKGPRDRGVCILDRIDLRYR